MGDLDEAIRDHLELKRRRGADPAEVAREEQEALAPVTRGHAIVVPEAVERAEVHATESQRNGDAEHDAHAEAPHQPAASREAESEHGDKAAAPEGLGDATQEFRVVLGDPDDWLEDEDES